MKSRIFLVVFVVCGLHLGNVDPETTNFLAFTYDWDWMNCHHGTYVSDYFADERFCNCSEGWTGVDCSSTLNHFKLLFKCLIVIIPKRMYVELGTHARILQQYMHIKTTNA